MKPFKLLADTWEDMISKMSDLGFQVDSKYEETPEQYVEFTKDNSRYLAKVTQFFKGDFEILSDNIQEVDSDKEQVTSSMDELYNPEDYAGGYTEWDEIATKSVKDADGFWTDYTMWYNPFTDLYVFIFGDKDIYYPENTSSYDWETDNYEEAKEWWDNYNGFEDDDIEGCNSIESAVDPALKRELIDKDPWELLELKQVEVDSGNPTDFALWKNSEDNRYACTYGDVYDADPDENADFESLNESKARAYFNAYDSKEDPIMSSDKIPDYELDLNELYYKLIECQSLAGKLEDYFSDQKSERANLKKIGDWIYKCRDSLLMQFSF